MKKKKKPAQGWSASGRKTLLLLDTHALIHRAYHALPPFRSKSGEPTGALYGLSTMLMKALNDFKPDYVVAAFDRPEPTFRHEAYENYKAQRPKAEDDLVSQLKRAHDVLTAFGIPILDAAGFEADDILGTIVEQAHKVKNLKIIIVSGDADTFQLVEDEHIVVYTMRKGIQDTIIYDQKKVEERYGFSPKQMPDYKGMRGDTSDNIVGVPGVGEKTATELIKHFGTLENLYKTIEAKNFVLPAFLKPRIFELLKTHKKDALFSKTLATIRRDVPIKFDLPPQAYALNRDGVKQIFSDLGFAALLRRFASDDSVVADKQATQKPSPVSGQASLLFSNAPSSAKTNENKEAVPTKQAEKNKKEFWDEMKKNDTLYVYTNEQTVSIKGKNKIWNLSEDFFHDKDEWGDVLKSKFFVLPFSKDFIKMILKNNLNAPHKLFDCALALWVSDSTFRGDSTEELYYQVLRKNISDDPASVLSFLPEIHQKIAATLKKKRVESVYYEIEMPLISILATMETRGIATDKTFLTNFRREALAKKEKLEDEIYSLAGESFNISSPAQVGELLANKLKITQTTKKGTSAKWKRTSTGKISTRESELAKLQDAHPIIKLILEFREIAKILTTYIDPLLELSKTDGRIHTTFNQQGTVTGRLSSDSPNLQNIPIRSDFGARIRDAFVASPGHTLAAFDYAQIELKILASLANDSKMINAFKNGIDIHRLTASEINNVALENVTPKMRSAAKAINFGIIYGMGVRQLAQTTGMSEIEATKFYREYFDDFPKIRGYMDETKKFVHKNGFVETLYGRKRFFDLRNIQGSRFLEAEMERMALNAIIQGTDADIMKKAMIAVHEQCDPQNARPLLQIHDEMIYEIPDALVESTTQKIKKIMDTIAAIKVPLGVEIKTGKRWGELVSIKMEQAK